MTTSPPTEVAPRDWGADPSNNNRPYLFWSYAAAILIPILGLIMAIYTGVAEKHASIRRHAFGIGAVSILSIIVYVVIITSVNSSNADSNVASNLRTLLNQNGVQYSSVTGCTHEQGNQYSCLVVRSGQNVPVQVTDDGHSIYEQGIAAP